MNTTYSTVAEAQAAYDEARARVDAARAAAKQAARDEAVALDDAGDAHREVQRLEAVEGRNALAVGTRVHHRSDPAITGTVVPNDGSGIAVAGDLSGQTSHGYAPGEWIAL